MRDEKKLKKLVQIIGDLLKIKGNEWLFNEILNTIGETTPVEDIAKHSVIQNIHEYCVEQKIEKQAADFYSSFPLTDIKNQLIQDYKKMEHERRRDDFEGFCLSMFQQIESIVNYCFESNEIKESLKNERNSPAFIEWNSAIKLWERKSNQRLIPFLLMKKNRNYEEGKGLPYYDISRKDEDQYFDQIGHPVVDYNPHKKSWSFLARFRTILFYRCFNSKLKQMELERIFSPGSELYTMRNQNHRESKPSDIQKEIIDLVKEQEGRYYFKFYGFLEDFVNRVESSYNKPNTLTTYHN